MSDYNYKKSSNTPLTRLFNVVFFLAYLGLFVVAVIAGFAGYAERDIVSATVQCTDGTSWDALKPKHILYDSYALCGICTNRSPDNSQYTNCARGSIDYSSYDTEIVKESWNWNTLLYPALVILIGYGIVDLARVLFFYIVEGSVDLSKSILLRIIRLFNEN